MQGSCPNTRRNFDRYSNIVHKKVSIHNEITQAAFIAETGPKNRAVAFPVSPEFCPDVVVFLFGRKGPRLLDGGSQLATRVGFGHRFWNFCFGKDDF